MLELLAIAVFIWLLCGSESEKPRKEQEESEVDKCKTRGKTPPPRPSRNYSSSYSEYEDTYIDQLGYEEDIVDQGNWNCGDFDDFNGGSW